VRAAMVQQQRKLGRIKALSWTVGIWYGGFSGAELKLFLTADIFSPGFPPAARTSEKETWWIWIPSLQTFKKGMRSDSQRQRKSVGPGQGCHCH